MSYNARSPAVKRLMKEAQELAEPTELYYAQPLEDNLFEWHFTIRGPEDTDFQGGIYHGRILLPSEYPMKPPNILLLTPNGRFEIKRKICLSISGYHPESWRPCWSIRTALLAIIGFMPTHGGGAIGSLEFSAEERKKLAKASVDFVCPDCGPTKSILLPQTAASIKDQEEAKTLAKQIDFQSEKQKASSTTPSNPNEANTVTTSTTTSTTINSQPALPTGINTSVPGFMPPWAHFYPYYAPYLLNQSGAVPPAHNMALSNRPGPLSFDQWLVQVKGYSMPSQTPSNCTSESVPRPPSPPPSSSAPETSVPANSTEAETKEPEPQSETAIESTETSNTNEEVEVQNEEPEEGVQETGDEEKSSLLMTPETSHSVDRMSQADEWPMFSLFVISFLLVVVLLFNRFCVPIIYRQLTMD